METIYSFGEWVRRRRKALNMTQENLAECVGCSPIMIRKIEGDERRPSEQITLRLAGCFNIPADDLTSLLLAARGERAVDSLAAPTVGVTPGIEHIGSQVRKLPVQTTSFTGRDTEMRKISERLERTDCRLLTLVGPGGIGKTRLAIQTAQKAAGFADGITYVSLTSLVSAEYLAVTVADALDLPLAGSADPQTHLVRQLSAREILLVLDNFEHILDGALLLGEIMTGAPRVKMLVTSRERLNLHGEWLYPVKGMSLPGNGETPSQEKSDAIQFFNAAAQRVEPDFSLSDNWHSVTRICRMVEGMPLGIELAAAQLHSLRCDEIADGLQTSLDILASSLRDVPERHRSLRGLFEHTWRMLSTDQQRVLEKVSLFRGGFTMAAAGEVADASPDIIRALVEKSLIRVVPEDRYDLHEVIRQYSAEHLDADPDNANQTRDSHSLYFMLRLEDKLNDLEGANYSTTINTLNEDIDNIRIASHRAVDKYWLDILWRTSVSLDYYLNFAGRTQEAEQFYQYALTTLLAVDPEPVDLKAREVLATYHQGLGWAAHRRGDYEEADRYFEVQAAFRREMGVPRETGLILHMIARNCLRSGQFDRGIAAAVEGLSYTQGTDNKRIYSIEISLINDLAYLYADTGHLEKSEAMIKKAWECAGATKGSWGYWYTLSSVARLALRRGDAPEAVRAAQEVMDNCTTPWMTISAGNDQGQAALIEGNPAKARVLFLQVLEESINLGEPFGELLAHTGLGYAALDLGDLDTAGKEFGNVIRDTLHKQVTPPFFEALVGAADLLIRKNQTSHACHLLRRVLDDSAAWHSTRQKAANLFAAIQQDAHEELTFNFDPASGLQQAVELL